MHLVEEKGARWPSAVAHRPLWEAGSPRVNVEPEGPSPRQDAAIAARSHRNPLPELDKGSPFLPRGSHPNTAQLLECESHPACRKAPRRPLLPGPSCHQWHWQLRCLDGPLHGGGPGVRASLGCPWGNGHLVPPCKSGWHGWVSCSPAPPQRSLGLHRRGTPTGQ